jgi:hypothetical protein
VAEVSRFVAAVGGASKSQKATLSLQHLS